MQATTSHPFTHRKIDFEMRFSKNYQATNLIYCVALALQSVVCIQIQSYLKNAEFFMSAEHPFF